MSILNSFTRECDSKNSYFSSSFIFQPILLFAGEHTHLNFYSTVHGAYLSGRTAAQQILEADRESEIVLDCEGTSDLSTWIRGMSLEN